MARTNIFVDNEYRSTKKATPPANNILKRPLFIDGVILLIGTCVYHRIFQSSTVLTASARCTATVGTGSTFAKQSIERFLLCVDLHNNQVDQGSGQVWIFGLQRESHFKVAGLAEDSVLFTYTYRACLIIHHG